MRNIAPSNNAVITTLFCTDSNEQIGRRENIRKFWVEDINDEDVHDGVEEVANDIGKTISKQNISVCHSPPSTNP